MNTPTDIPNALMIRLVTETAAHIAEGLLRGETIDHLQPQIRSALRPEIENVVEQTITMATEIAQNVAADPRTAHIAAAHRAATSGAPG